MIQQLLNTIQNNTDKKMMLSDYLTDNEIKIACLEDKLNTIKTRLIEIKARLKRENDFRNGLISTEQLHAEFTSKNYQGYLLSEREYNDLITEFYTLRNDYIMALDTIENIKDDVSEMLNKLRDNNIVYCQL